VAHDFCRSSVLSRETLKEEFTSVEDIYAFKPEIGSVLVELIELAVCDGRSGWLRGAGTIESSTEVSLVVSSFPTSVTGSFSYFLACNIFLFSHTNVPSSYPYNFLYFLFFSLLRAKQYSAPPVLLVYALI